MSQQDDMESAFDWSALPEDVWAEDKCPEELESRILKSCQDVQRNRRLRRTSMRGLMAVVLFASGLGLGRLLPSKSPSSEGPSTVPLHITGQAKEGTGANAPGHVDEKIHLSAEQIEVQAELAIGQKQRELYRQAGDAFLDREHDLQGAMRCYEVYLDLLSAETRRDSDRQDTWLLASLRRTL